MKKIAVITCYFNPDYIRAQTLRSAVKSSKNYQTVIIKNRRKNILRYPEILWSVTKLRFTISPDAYVITFRGQEILPYVLLLAGKKPVIFDEFIVPIAYARQEPHQKSFSIHAKHVLARMFNPLYKICLRNCSIIFADTLPHAEFSAQSSHVNMRQYCVVPVGTDEKLFTPSNRTKSEIIHQPFQVFYYANMLPLHGLSVILSAAIKLSVNTNIKFYIVGGQRAVKQSVKNAQIYGANINYERWIDFNDIPLTIHNSALTLGGPFGDTLQAQHVITGKTYQFLACAAPVVIGQNEATMSYFVDKQNALIVPQNDPDALTQVIDWAYKNRSELVVIGRNGRQSYDKYFSQSVINTIVTNRIEEVI